MSSVAFPWENVLVWTFSMLLGNYMHFNHTYFYLNLDLVTQQIYDDVDKFFFSLT